MTEQPLRREKTNLDWDGVELFCMVAEAGGLRQAARHAAISVETIRRKISRLESVLGFRLFRRTPSGAEITRRGKELYADAVVAREKIVRIERMAEKRRKAVPQMTVAATEALLSCWIMPMFLKQASVTKSIILNFKPIAPNQRYGSPDADIVIQHNQPSNDDLICRRIGYMHTSFFCAPAAIRELTPLSSTEHLTGKTLLMPGEDADAEAYFSSELQKRREFDFRHVSLSHYAQIMNFLSIDPNAVGILPSCCVGLQPYYRPAIFSEPPTLKREVWLGYQRDVRDVEECDALLNWIIDIFVSATSPWFRNSENAVSNLSAAQSVRSI